MRALNPVLELSPWSFSKRERPIPSGSVKERPEDWLRYWTESLQDAGLEGLQPWTPGSWLVSLDQLRDPTHLRVFVAHAVPALATAAVDGISALSGGYILSQGEAAIFPGCCGDLGNLDEWARAAEEASASWSMVWIGHPWTFVRASGDLLHFTELSENSDAEGLAEHLVLPRSALQEAVAVALEERRSFAERLLPVVRSLKTETPAAHLVEVLVGGRP